MLLLLRLIIGVATFVLAAPLAAMLAEPFFSSLLAELEIDTSEWAGPVVTSLQALVSQAWFQLLAAAVFGAAVSAWLHWLATKYDRQRAAEADAPRRRALAEKEEARRRITERDGQTFEALAASLGRLVARAHAATAIRDQAERDKWQSSFDEAHALISTLNRRGPPYKHALGTLTESARAIIGAYEATEYEPFLKRMGIHHRLFHINAFQLEMDDIGPDG